MSEVELTLAIALNLWRRAAKEEMGVKVPIKQPDLRRVQDIMYKARKEANDPSLEKLSLIVAPGGTEVWVVKQTMEVP